jgi:hypothetical protein
LYTRRPGAWCKRAGAILRFPEAASPVIRGENYPYTGRPGANEELKMKMRSMLVVTVAVMALSSFTAMAHPEGHEDEKAIPKTCTELADKKRFTDDASYPEVKALKARCDTEKKASTQKPAPKPAAEKKT